MWGSQGADSSQKEKSLRGHTKHTDHPTAYRLQSSSELTHSTSYQIFVSPYLISIYSVWTNKSSPGISQIACKGLGLIDGLIPAIHDGPGERFYKSPYRTRLGLWNGGI